MKKITFSFIALLAVLFLYAAPPAGYYDTAVGKKEAELKTALMNKIKGHTVVSYANLYTVYATSDVTSDGKVWDMYSTCTWTPGQSKCGSYSTVCDCYNREHSIPQSWFNEASPMKSDAFHVYPTDGKVNGQRSSYPYGECSGGTTLSNGRGKLGNSTFSGYSGIVFEPDDEFKGDFARTYFYFVTRYESQISGFKTTSTHFAANTYPSLTTWSINLFLKWHRQDPVSEKEIARNEAVYKHQKNRNPFIDYPSLAEHIWGAKMNENWEFTSGVIDAEYGSSNESFMIKSSSHSKSVVVSAPFNGSAELRIFDVSGKMVHIRTVQLNEEISTSMLPLNSGIFIAKAKTQTGKDIMGKIVIQK